MKESLRSNLTDGIRNSADLRSKSLPCLRLGHITADKKLRCYAPSLKFANANFSYPHSAIRNHGGKAFGCSVR